MRNIKITFKGANPKDPLAVMPTVGVSVEIAGKERGNYMEFDHEPSAEEVCEAVQFLLLMFQMMEKG